MQNRPVSRETTSDGRFHRCTWCDTPTPTHLDGGYTVQVLDTELASDAAGRPVDLGLIWVCLRCIIAKEVTWLALERRGRKIKLANNRAWLPWQVAASKLN